ncbi:hypothetical protein LTR78_004138 [Recurvomyces mirabilis]|uniref:Uncharacterized protein n=1 Tax=Recurvomyces mirabilis TaxID=574656 RepID=A0AAE0WQF3_9PEZI|nr:hypothetical protein LTR78_004138 [Recurvomyces mirabilis]
MGSKKQRLKAAKVSTTPSAKPTTTEHGQTLRAVRCHCVACEKGFKVAGIDTNSPFLRLHREIRDRIYEELLVAKLSPANQAQIDQINAASDTPLEEYGRQNALELYGSDTVILPGANERYRYRFIIKAVGLLLANKQINAEANSILFSKNIFGIMPEWERIYPFWRCDNKTCDPPGAPCYLMFHNFLQIKHVNIMNECINLLHNNITIVRFFKSAQIKLKTLSISYSGCFGGEVEYMRDDFEGPLPPGMPARLISMRDMHGEFYNLTREEARQTLFRDHEVMEPFKQWYGAAEEVTVRGEMPQAFIGELVAALTNQSQSSVTKRVAKAKAANAARGPKINDSSIWVEMRDDALAMGNQSLADMAEQMMQTSIKSPAVMQHLFGDLGGPFMSPQTGNDTAQQPTANNATGRMTVNTGRSIAATTSNGTTSNNGGIGTVNGKIVFGPPRPLSML